MITKSNYYDKIKDISINDLPDTLKAGHEFVEEATGKGQDWSTYEGDKEIKEVIDLYFQKLDTFVKAAKVTAEQKPANPKTTSIPVSTKEGEKRKASITPKTPKAKPNPSPRRRKIQPKVKSKKQVAKFTGKLVEAYDEEILLIRRMLNMHEKEKTKHQILLFINAIQRRILEKKIRKTSPHASHIKFIQEWLVDLYNKMGETVKVVISDKRFEDLSKITGSRRIRTSVRLIKRYISLHGKNIEMEKVKSLYHAITNAIKKGKIPKSDPYYEKLKKIIDSLQNFNCGIGNKGQLQIHHTTLKGLYGILDGVEPTGLGEVQPMAKNVIMNSEDIKRLKFKRLGFHGKWLELIGDPSPGFTAMIYGKPKLGKSTLAVDFAGYLAEFHGKVLYVAKEEGIEVAIQDKLAAMDAAHPNLDFSDFLPNSLSSYDFVVLDSVNKLQLSPEDLDDLRTTYPKTSFVFIFKTTKDGKFRGSNDFQHDVDVVIEVPERGLAIQNGRFNKGATMKIN